MAQKGAAELIAPRTPTRRGGEAVRGAGSPTFSIGVQWHAEYRTEEHDFYRALFAAFGEAVADHALARGQGNNMGGKKAGGKMGQVA